MKKHLASMLIVASLLFITSCKENKTAKQGTEVPPQNSNIEVTDKAEKKLSTGDFSVDTPEGWTRKDSTMMGSKAVFLISELEGKRDLFKQNINVLTEKVGTMSFADYMELSFTNISKMLTNYKLKDQKDIMVDGIEAKSIDYSHSLSGYDIDVNAVMFIKNSRAYIITSSDEKGKLDRWRDVIEKTVASFHIQ